MAFQSARLRAFLLALAVAFFCASAGAAMLSVVVEPEAGAAVRLYPSEITSYRVVAINNDTATLENIFLRVSVEGGLAIVENGTRLLEKKFEPFSLKGEGREEKRITVKAMQSGAKKFGIVVEYGISGYTHTSSTTLAVSENPAAINARLSKTALSRGEEGAIVLDVTNTTDAKMHDISAELKVPEGIKELSGRFYLAELAPGQAFSNREFSFQPGGDMVGRNNIILEVSYTDAEGKHTLQKDFVVDIQDREQYILVLAAGIVLLVIVSYFIRKRGREPIDTSGLKISEIKAPPQKGSGQSRTD
ncbi:MAG: hypothetical protein ABH854_04910 [Candidatus Diapherotrites archaeon]